MKYFDEAEQFLNQIISAKGVTDQGKLEAIQDFINIGELEMAFEGAFLCFIEQKTEFSKDEKEKIIRYGEVLKLDQETVYDPEFWSACKDN